MRTTPVFALALLLVLAACMALSASPPPLATEALFAALRQGGHVIYLRHTAADVGRDEPRPGTSWWASCGEGHRMLSARGRADASSIGQALRALRVPVVELRSSEYCRAVETARALGLGEPATDARLNGWPMWRETAPADGLVRLAQGTRELLTAVPPEGGNRLLVSHKQDFANPSHPVLAELAEGEAAVFRPGGSVEPVLVARVTAAEWMPRRRSKEILQP